MSETIPAEESVRMPPTFTAKMWEERDINTPEVSAIKLATEEEVILDHQKISEINDDLNELLEKRDKINSFFNISLKQLFVRMSNATTDVLKEFIEVIFKRRRFKYQDKFKWWNKYSIIGKDMWEVLQKNDRLMYFGVFLIFLAILLNFLDMIN